MFNFLTLVKNRPNGGAIPRKARAAPDTNKEALPVKYVIPLCCIDTAKKIETEVGGAMMNGISVKKAPTMHPKAQVTVVAIMESCSSYPARFIWNGTTGKT